ncbi:2OG-Fe(II) oxygenase [Polymorphobacter sp. PAMC 29334]|uniref:2OG-Fe(II) oxygenase n=1 Tax=Polymorphobacter sp. PAMC 29334 TaxID=2862331 RepID=UPI001C6813B5|nr:2OG-Fe(II) oxygenase [Polymorphobacter sp. PAMC 29334]QYE35102.1 2OG-Fe(II) oxygenase [Polymorphobacter sp. PAMC 29334]
MPILETTNLSTDVVALDKAQCITAGAALHERYAAADPFPHIVLDDFLDADVLRRLAAEWPETSPDRTYYDRSQERLKYEWQPHDVKTPGLRAFLAEMNAEPMVRFIESLTGIKKLIADPYYVGAGLHETKRGGHLGVHADFNIHKGMDLLRRVNLLIYLNDDWLPEWNGDLELWSTDMKERRLSVPPKLGRAVIFNTDLDSFHGVPDVIACPPERSRRSIALYYYTSPVDGLANVPKRTTVFRPRPGTADKPDREVARRHFVNDWVPPALLRALKRH